MNKFYLTTAIPYVNAKPHVGHALEFVQADVIKRYRKSLGDDVLLLSGADENAIKNVQAAEKENVEVQKFIDIHSKEFEELAEKLNIKFDVFQRGSSSEHHKASQELWKKCFESGDIYKKTYTGLYCVGCELFYEKSELNENGECFEHPGKPLEEVSEENYFFKLSKYQKQIEKLIESDELKIYPQFRKNEVLGFLKEGLRDISISRSNTRAKNWGVEVPGDDSQRMYVWFDALNIYQSGVGFGSDEKEYKKWWPADLHVIGKGIIRFHAVYWPAFLLSAGLPIPKALFVHGYFTVDGQKMSKSLGNVIDPIELIKKYGEDALRYYFLRELSPFADGDFSVKRLEDVYNGDLANSLGNTVSRLAKLAENSGIKFDIEELPKKTYSEELEQVFEEYRFNDILQNLWVTRLHSIDRHINQNSPWLITDKARLKHVLQEEITMLREFAKQIAPFMPKTSDAILEQFSKEEIKSASGLFPRI